VELRVTATARDGAGVARAADGRVIFVEGALPGERVLAEVYKDDRRWSRARVTEVLDPSPNRIPVVCESQIAGCGGCDMLHVESLAQARMKTSIVVDQLCRAGVDFPVPALRLLDGDEGRTMVRAAVVEGRAGFRLRSSHEVVTPDSCGATDDRAEELLVDGRYGAAEEVMIRVGSRTGERMVVVDGPSEEVRVPDDVLVVTQRELDAGRRAWIHEEAGGRSWRISARSFFQNRPAGADALVAEVTEMVDELGPDGRLVDAYAGVGLFAGTAGAGRPTTAVEKSRDSVADARVNLGDGAKVVRASVERWRSSPAQVVVADPAREGLGEAGVRALTAVTPELIVLVSCDPSAFARDALLLDEAGYDLDRWTVVDIFPLTSHVETVAGFVAG
jgi:23S rRNA (uracil1939-C5)-methyltransferase